MADTDNNRYFDWHHDEAHGDRQSTPETSSAFTQNVVIMPEPHSTHWHAVFALDDHNGHEEYYGTRDEAIAWARDRCSDIHIWSETTQDLEALTAD